MAKIFSYFFVAYILGIGQTYAQISQKAKEINTECLKKFATLKPSQQDKSEQGIPYSVFVLREGSTWIVAITDTGSFYSFRKMRKVDTLTANSSAFDLNLCKLLEKPERFILKEKSAKIGDIDVPHYYTLNREGGRMFGAIQQAETGIKNLSAIGKGIASVGSAIGGIFSIFKPTALIKQVDALKKQITDQEALIKKQTDEMKKQTDEMKKQTDVIKKQSEEMKKLQEETAKLKKAQEDAIKAQEQAKADLEKAKAEAEDKKTDKKPEKNKKEEPKKEAKKEEPKKEEPKKEETKKEEPKKETPKEEEKKDEKKEQTEKADETSKIVSVKPEEDLSKLSKKERKKREKERKKREKDLKNQKTSLNLKPYPHLNNDKKEEKNVEEKKDTTKPKNNTNYETIHPKKNRTSEDSIQVHITNTINNIDALQKKYALERQKLDFEVQRAELLKKQRELQTGKEENATKEAITLQSMKQQHLESLKLKVRELDDLLLNIKNSGDDTLKYQVPAIRQKRQELKKEIATFETPQKTEKSNLD